jgi:mannosyltransferase OCH1-like enzyme
MGAAVNPVSYRLLWYSQTGKFVSPLMTESEIEAGIDVGTLDAMSLERSGKIPRIIFQTTASRPKLPPTFRYWSTTFLRQNPDFVYALWDNSDNRNFIGRKFPWFIEQYDSFPSDSYRLDIIRSFFLYMYGGFYAHMDSECIRPVQALREAGDVVLGRMGRDPDFEQSIPNAIMASKPRQAFWLLTIALATERLKQMGDTRPGHLPPEEVTGPVMLKRAVDFYLNHSAADIAERIEIACPGLKEDIQTSKFGKLALLPAPIWCPINWNDFIQKVFRQRMARQHAVLDEMTARRLFPHAYIVTYWSMEGT